MIDSGEVALLLCSANETQKMLMRRIKPEISATEVTAGDS